MPGSTPALGHIDIRRQRRTAKAAQIERQHDMAFGAQRRSDTRGMVKLDAVALVVVDGQRQQAKPSGLGHRRHRGRIEPAREQDDGKGARAGHAAIGEHATAEFAIDADQTVIAAHVGTFGLGKAFEHVLDMRRRCSGSRASAGRLR